MLEPMRRDSGPAVAVAAVLAAERDPRRARAGARGRSRHSQARRVPRRLPAAPPAPRPKGGSSPSASSPPIRRPATATSAPARSSTARPCARSRRSSRSPMPRPPRATWPIAISGTAAISCFTPRPCWARSSASSRRWRRPQGGGRRPHARPRFPAARGGAVRARAEEVDRLCGDGAHQARRRGSRRPRLVRRRQLERGLGRPRSRRRRQRDRRPGRHAGQPQQPGALGGSRC